MAFVGRDIELDLIARDLALTAELSVGRSLFLMGPPGAGKTTLVSEALERVARERPDMLIARGRCLQTFGGGDPYFPFVSALQDLADESTQGFVKRETLSGLLTELAPYWLQVVPLVGGLLSATFATAARLSGQTGAGTAPSREALFVQYLELIKRIAQQSPLILFLDDLHWADQSSVALLAHVARGIERLPVAILGTFRTGDLELDRHPILELVRELERESSGTRIPLGELDPGAVRTLLRTEFGGDVSEPLQRWIARTAGANPLFVSELVRLLKHSDAVVEKKGEWFLTEAISTIEIPRSAEAVIESRIQRLEPDEIRVLQYASVEGNEFNSTVLAGLLEMDELALLDLLERLERRHQLIHTTGELDLPDGDIATLLEFRHALVQTVLYRQVVGKRRILLHRKAGELLELMHANSAETVAGKLARHYFEGRMPEQAHRHARVAADRARRVFAHWEAEEFYRIALDTSLTDEDRIELVERLGDVYDAVGLYEKSISCMQRALELNPASPATVVRLRRKMIPLERQAGLTPAPLLVQRLRTLLEEATAHPREHTQLLLELTYLPNATGVLEAATRAVEIAEQLDDPLLLADALRQLAFMHIFAGGRSREALPLLARARELIADRNDLLRNAIYANAAAIAHAKIGQYENARVEFQSLVELTERLGDPGKISNVCSNLGAVLLRLGLFAEAEQILERARSIHERRNRAGLTLSLLNLGECARQSGNLPRALAFFTQLLDCARELEYWTSEAVAHAGIGLCHLESGHLEGARESAWSAVAVIADHEEWFEDREFIELLLARLEVIDEEPAAAFERLTRAATALQPVDVYAWARLELERVELARSTDPELAGRLLIGLVEAMSGVQSPPLAARLARLCAVFPQVEAPEPA